MGVDPDRTYAEVEEALRMIGSMWRGDDGETSSGTASCSQVADAPDPAATGADAAPAALPRVHEERHREARGRVRHRRARARLRRARRRRRAAPHLRRDDRARGPASASCRRRSTTTSRRCARRSCSTTATRRCRSVRAVSASSPSRSRTGTPAGPSPSRATRTPTRSPRSAKAEEQVITRLHEAKIPRAAEHDRDLQRRARLRHVEGRDRVRRAARRRRRRRDHVPHPDGHGARRRPAWRRSASGASTSSRTSPDAERSRPRLSRQPAAPSTGATSGACCGPASVPL